MEQKLRIEKKPHRWESETLLIYLDNKIDKTASISYGKIISNYLLSSEFQDQINGQSFDRCIKMFIMKKYGSYDEDKDLMSALWQILNHKYDVYSNKEK